MATTGWWAAPSSGRWPSTSWKTCCSPSRLPNRHIPTCPTALPPVRRPLLFPRCRLREKVGGVSRVPPFLVMASPGAMIPINQVLTGDCLRLLAGLPEACVDLAFADPPFNIGYDYDVYDDR